MLNLLPERLDSSQSFPHPVHQQQSIQRMAAELPPALDTRWFHGHSAMLQSCDSSLSTWWFERG